MPALVQIVIIIILWAHAHAASKGGSLRKLGGCGALRASARASASEEKEQYEIQMGTATQGTQRNEDEPTRA